MTYIKPILLMAIVFTCFSFNANSQDITNDSLLKSGLSPLNGDNLKEIIIGNTLIHTSSSGQTIPMYYRPDGKRVFTMGARRFEGPYAIKDNRRCESSSQGGEVCMTIYKIKPTQYVVCDPRDGGRCIWTMEIEPGNSRGIQ